MQRNNVIVVGGGASGLIAALSAGEAGAKVTLLERGNAPGKKLSITGKGRCNLTNDCSVEETLANIPRGGRFLHGAMARFTPGDTKAFFTALGVPLKTERGNRVFPRSDRAADVVSALLGELSRRGVRLQRARAFSVSLESGAVRGVETDRGFFPGDKVILATGGLSYPRTGSTGDGYKMAAALGHTVTPLSPSLVPLESEDAFCAAMQGLSLKNVALRVEDGNGKPVYQDFGELLFTHFGLSGPMILSASAHMQDFDRTKYRAVLDLKPALEEKALDQRLLRELSAGANREARTILASLLPRLMVPVAGERSGIPLDLRANSVTKVQRQRLLRLLKGFDVSIRGPRPVEEAIVTSGGVELAQINPSTLESRLISGLYVVGELLNADGYTGGFNLQIAWATGRTAGLHAAK